LNLRVFTILNLPFIPDSFIFPSSSSVPKEYKAVSSSGALYGC
jgi:hypothetical protein